MQYGKFPFGQPNTVRPIRMPVGDSTKVMVVGVYPSAFHVTWTAPARLRRSGCNGRVQSMAVDVEPVVFWNGQDPDPGDLLERWKREVGFVDGNHAGAHGSVVARGNGPSGCKVQHRYLAPLATIPEQAAYADVYPVYMAKRGTARRPEQWDAIEREYHPIAEALGFDAAWLPRRLRPPELVSAAIEEYGGQLVDGLRAAHPKKVVTLGDEALSVILGIQELPSQLPQQLSAPKLSALLAAGLYGKEGAVWLDGRRVPWLPLVHPGQLRTCRTPDLPSHLPPVPDPDWPWDHVHAWWQAEQSPA